MAKAAVLSLWVAAVMGLALAASLPARAQGDPFAVTGVEVDAAAGSAIAAKEVAWAEGKAAALQKVLRRLTARYNWPLLPSPDPETIETMLASFSISDEKTSATRYIATMDVSFIPSAVTGLLEQAGVSYSSTRSDPALILPVFEREGEPVLWDANPWRAAWENADVANAITPVLLPLGDAQDFVALDAERALSADQAGLNDLANRYGVNRVIVAHAIARPDAGLDVTLTSYGEPAADPVRERFSGPTIDAAARTAVSELLPFVADQWRASQVRRSVEKPVAGLTASIVFSGLQDWLITRRRLEAAGDVEAVDVLALNADGALVDIAYRGDPAGLAAALEAEGLGLYDLDGTWSIAKLR